MLIPATLPALAPPIVGCRRKQDCGLQVCNTQCVRACRLSHSGGIGAMERPLSLHSLNDLLLSWDGV